MFAKVVILAVVLVGVNSRYLLVPEVEFSHIQDIDHVTDRIRVRRAQATISADNKGIVELSGRLPLTKLGNNNVLSAIGSTSPNGQSYGLALDNVCKICINVTNINKSLAEPQHELTELHFTPEGSATLRVYEKGHSLSLSEKHIPDFGKQQTLGGNLNLVDTDKHNFNANAFVTKNIPKFHEMPNFKTVGGGLDYTYNKNIGAGINLAHTDFLKRTDVSAMGNLNLFRNPTTSVDFSAGASRTFSPYFPKSSWEPDFRFSLSKYF